MAKATYGPTVSEIRGKAGDTVFTRTRGGNVARALKLSAAGVGPHNLLSVTHLDTTPTTPPTRGSLITGQAAVTLWKELLLGTSGYFLKSNGVDALWSNLSPYIGIFTVGDGTGAQTSVIDGGAGYERALEFRTGGVRRWRILATAGSESGSDTGSHFNIQRRSDAGAFLGSPVIITRATGYVGLGSITPGKMLDVAGDIRASLQLISTVATGTAPLAVASTTEVANLRAATASDLAAGIILGSAKGGTGNGFAKLTGPATAEKTFTLPNLNATIPATLAVIDLLNQTAAIGTTTLLPSGNNTGGLYRISFVAKITTAATTSSTLGGAGSFQIWNVPDADDSVYVNTPAGLPFNNTAAGLALNTTQVIQSGVIIFNAKAANVIAFRYGYTSSGATPMAFSLHITIEKM